MVTNMKGVYRSMWWAFGGQTVPGSLATRVRTHAEMSNRPDAVVEYPKNWPMRLLLKQNVRF